MATLTHKTTILLSPHEHRFLKETANRQNTTMGQLIRSAIQKIWMKKPPSNQKKIIDGWNKLFQANAPVADWPEMEKEIIEGWLK